jgi:ABC-type cobalt transport system substrate-binding protein
MRQFTHKRRALLALAVVVAIIAVAYPTCRMVGCSASSYGAQMSGPGAFGLGAAMGDVKRIVNDCGGQFLSSTNPIGVMPSGIESLLFALAAALVAGIAVLVPRVSMQLVLVPLAEPPPPPLDPRGERFIL